MNELAQKHNCEDYNELLNVMYSRFEEICEEKFQEIVSNKEILFEAEKEGEWVIYTNNEEKARAEYEDYSTILKDRYTSFSGLESFTQEEREYDGSEFRDITFATDSLEDFEENAEFGQKAEIDGTWYYKVYDEKSDNAYTIYFTESGLKTL